MPKLYPPEFLFYQVTPEDMFSRDSQHRLGNVFPIEPTGPIAGVSGGVRPAPSMGHQWLMTNLLNQVSIAQALSGPLHKR